MFDKILGPLDHLPLETWAFGQISESSCTSLLAPCSLPTRFMFHFIKPDLVDRVRLNYQIFKFMPQASLGAISL